VRGFVQAHHGHRTRRPRLFYGLVLRIEHALDAPVGHTCHHDVACAQRAVLDEQRGDRPAPGFHPALQHCASGRVIRVRPNVRLVGNQQDRLEQILDPFFGLGADRYHQRIAAPLIGLEVQVGQLLLDAVLVSVGAVDLVERHDDRHARRPRMGQRLARGGHHAIICRHHQHRNVGTLRAPRAHGRERFVARRVQKGNRAVAERHLVSSNMLGDTARLAFLHVRLANHVQQRGLAVVDVPQHGHHWRARHQRIRVFVGVQAAPLGRVGVRIGRLRLGRANRACLEAHPIDDDRRCVIIDLLVNRCHDPIADEFLHHVDRAGTHQVRKLADAQKVRYFQDLFLLSHRISGNPVFLPVEPLTSFRQAG